VLRGDTLDRAAILGEGGPISAEQLYINQKVVDLVSKAEMEQADYREDRHLNVFFGPIKEYFGIRAPLLVFNAGVLVISTFTLLVILYFILRHQLRREWL